MDDFERWWNDRSKFFKGLRTGDHDASLEALGYWRSGPLPGSSLDEPEIPPSPESSAAYKRGRVCGVITSGLINHPDRLNAEYWRQVDEWLQRMSPQTPGLAGHLDDLIEQWSTFFDQASESRGVWDLMSAA